MQLHAQADQIRMGGRFLLETPEKLLRLFQKTLFQRELELAHSILESGVVAGSLRPVDQIDRQLVTPRLAPALGKAGRWRTRCGEIVGVEAEIRRYLTSRSVGQLGQGLHVRRG